MITEKNYIFSLINGKILSILLHNLRGVIRVVE